MNFESVWKRISKEFDIKNYSDLARILLTTSSNITKKKQKNDFPVEWAYALGEKFGVTTEWILTGSEPKIREVGNMENFAKEKTAMSVDIENEGEIEDWVDCYWNKKFIKKVPIIEGGLYEIDPINPKNTKNKGEKVIIIDKGFVGPSVCLMIDSSWHLKRREYFEIEPCDLKLISKKPESEELKKIIFENIENYKNNA